MPNIGEIIWISLYIYIYRLIFCKLSYVSFLEFTWRIQKIIIRHPDQEDLKTNLSSYINKKVRIRKSQYHRWMFFSSTLSKLKNQDVIQIFTKSRFITKYTRDHLLLRYLEIRRLTKKIFEDSKMNGSISFFEFLRLCMSYHCLHIWSEYLMFICFLYRKNILSRVGIMNIDTRRKILFTYWFSLRYEIQKGWCLWRRARAQGTKKIKMMMTDGLFDSK